MEISILHLSDLHYKENSNSFVNKLDNLVDIIKNKIITINRLFVLISGDLAYSGEEKQFDEVKKTLEYIETELKKTNSDLRVDFVFAPGNHDCDFGTNTDMKMRTIFLSATKQENCDLDVVNELTKVQVKYEEFIEKYSSTNNINRKISNKLLQKYEYEVGGYKISFNSYNTAWMSSRREKQSEMFFPLNLIEKDDMLNDESNLRVSFFHHPYHWLEHQNIREFKEFIKNSSDLLFTGHEHVPTANVEMDYINGSNVIHIEAGTIQDSYNERESKFNLLKIDMKANKKHLFVFEWNNNDFYVIHEKKMNGTGNNDRNIFKLKPERLKKINELGLKVNHPRKDNVLLSDLFIYPDLKLLKEKDSLTNSSIKSSAEEILNKEEVGYSVIYGDDNSGKSVLLDNFQYKFLEKEKIAINICAKNFKKNLGSESIDKIIRKSFKNQYVTNNNVFKEFDKLDRNSIVLLVDDFHKANGNNEYKAKIIEVLKGLKYINIIVFTNSSLKLEATAETALAVELKEFNHYAMEEFGHRLRDKLITKWIKLGQEYDIEQIDLSTKRRQVAAHLSQTIGFNIVPSYPIYLITLLQATEIKDSSLDKSSFGHYYNFLIMQYLNAEKTLENKDINTIYTYCGELAFNRFSLRKHEYTYSELQEFDAVYKNTKDFFPSFNILDKIIKTTILVEHNGSYKFAQKYIYYYFVAYHFSRNIDKPEITSIIKAMTERLYRTEFSNILMFILHLSPKSDIIQMLIDQAKCIFIEIEEFSFAKKELKIINSCVKSDVDNMLQFENRTIEESREIEVIEEDKKSEIIKTNGMYFNDKEDADYREEIQQLDFFKKLNLAFKIIEILGEITKNYSGTLDGPVKTELVQLSYTIGLKSLKVIISLFEEHHEQLVKDIKSIILKKKKVTEDKINEEIYGMIFGLASVISIDIIKRIAKAVGTKDLIHLFKRMSEENSENIAYLVLKIAINLDFAGGLNKNEIVDLYNSLKEDLNRLPNSILKSLVLDHLYMFETSIQKKNSICSLLEIDSKDNQKKLVQKQNK